MYGIALFSLRPLVYEFISRHFTDNTHLWYKNDENPRFPAQNYLHYCPQEHITFMASTTGANCNSDEYIRKIIANFLVA
jgi:hypothetical protein